MTSTYFGATELAEVKGDLGISGTGQDTTLNSYSDRVESRMHDIMQEMAEKHRRVDQLPVLPLTGAKITQTIKDACMYGIKAKWYESPNQKDEERAIYYWQQLATLLSGWVKRQKVNRQIYGRII